MPDQELFTPIQVIDKKEYITEDDLQSVTVSTDDFRLILDIWLSAPLRFLVSPLLKLPIYLMYMLYTTLVSIVLMAISVGWGLVLPFVHKSTVLSVFMWGIFILIVVVATVFMILPTPLLMMVDAGVKQGLLRALSGEDVPLFEWVFPQRCYWPRLFVLSIVVIIVDMVLTLSLVGIPLIYLANILLFATFSYFLLSRPELSIVQIFVFAIKANLRNIIPLCIFCGIVVLLGLFSQLSTLIGVLTFGFVTIIEFVYAAKIAGELTTDGQGSAGYDGIHTEHLV